MSSLREFIVKELGYEDIRIPHPKAVGRLPDIITIRSEANVGGSPRMAYYKLLVSTFGVTSPTLQQKAILHLEKAAESIKIPESVGRTLKILQERGVKVGVITNSTHTTKEKLAWFSRAGLDIQWDLFINSCEVGIEKPDPRIFLKAFNAFGGRTNILLFVGHRQDELDGAKSVGFIPVAFEEKGETLDAKYRISDLSDLLDLEHLRKEE